MRLSMRESACFVVRDHSGQTLAYVYYEDEPGRRSVLERSLAGTTIGSQVAHERRGAKDRGEYRQAAGTPADATDAGRGFRLGVAF
jgi:hypothetical protein